MIIVIIPMAAVMALFCAAILGDFLLTSMSSFRGFLKLWLVCFFLITFGLSYLCLNKVNPFTWEQYWYGFNWIGSLFNWLPDLWKWLTTPVGG